MTNAHHITLPPLDDMLFSLLLPLPTNNADVEPDLRQHLFPVTRTNVYLNHAANGPPPRPVARAVHQYIDDVSAFGGTHEPQWAQYEQRAHRRVAALINARPDQLAFTANTSDGLMMVAQGLQWQEGDTIISAEGKFPSNVYPWLNLREQGVQLQTIPTRNHRIVAEELCEHISARTRLVSLSLVEFSTGYRNDIATIASYCHQRGILFGIDAMQALGAIDIDVQALGVDYLASGSHKWLLSPHTTGILYVSDNLLPQLHTPRRGWFSIETPFDFFHHTQPLKAGAARFEYSSSNMTPIIGLDASLGLFESIDGGMRAVEARILGLTDYAIDGLQGLGYPVVTPQGKGERSGIVCFQPHPAQAAMTAQQIVEELASLTIYAAARSGVVRISPHFYNTIEEIDLLLNALEDMKQ